ncbi:YeeE/YedE family protein [bacterium]|nr:YeeE/YedE family protein [bacterium]
MKNSITAFGVGVLFAIGLGLSGMTQPQKVIGFLDLFGDWDPSLLFVMGGAVGVHFFAYRWSLQRTSPLFSLHWHIPNKKEITPSLIFGSLLFGVGWGIAGYCPGPSLTSLVTLSWQPILFVASMISGMYLYRLGARYGFF